MARNSQLRRADLKQFTGGLTRYRSVLNSRVVYTEGVQFVAERAEAYWLVNAITSYFGSPAMQEAFETDARVQSIQFWRLTVRSDNSAVLTARADSDVEPFITQDISATDFPLQWIDVWAGFDGEVWTLYLPSEH